MTWKSKEQLQEEIDLLEKYRDQVAAFRKFCIEKGYLPDFEEEDFNGIALGFFAASGVPIDDLGDDEVDPVIFHLARICRYDFQYWEGSEEITRELGNIPLYYSKDLKGRIIVKNAAGEIVARQRESA